MSEAINLAELLVRISGDASGLRGELAKSVQEAKHAAAEHETALGKIGSALLGVAETAAVAAAAIGTLVVGIAAELTKVGLESASSMSVLSDKLNLSTESLSGMKVAAEEAGVSFDSVTTSLGLMQKNIGAAVQDNDQLAKAFARLGLNADDLANLHSDEAFGKIADALNNVGNATERARIQTEIFGRGGIELTNVLRKGSAGLAEATEKADKLGTSLKDIDAKEARQAIIALEEIKSVVLGIAQNLAVGLAPYIKAVANAFTDWAQASGGWKDLIGKAIEAVAKGVGFLGDVWQKVVQGWESAKVSFAELSVGVLKAMAFWAPEIALVGSAFKNFFAAISASWGSVKATFVLGIDFINDKFHGFATGVKNVFGQLLVDIGNAMFRIKGLASEAQATVDAGYAMERASSQTQDEAHQQFLKAGDEAKAAAEKAKAAWGDLANDKQTVATPDFTPAITAAEDSAQQAHAEWQAALDAPLNSTVIEKKLADIREDAAKTAAEAVAASANVGGGGGGTGGKGPDVSEVAAAETRRQRLKQLEQDAADESQIEEDAYAERLKQLDALEAAHDITHAKRDELELKLKAKHNQKLMELDAREIKTGDDLAKASAQRKVQWAVDSLASIINGVQAHSRKMFDIQKAASLAAATIDIAAGVCKAFGQGGFYGFAMAAAVAAAGVVQLSNIASQQYSGGGGGASSIGAAPSASVSAAATPNGIGGNAADAGQTVHIHVDGSESSTINKKQLRDLIDSINDQARDGVRIQSIQVA